MKFQSFTVEDLVIEDLMSDGRGLGRYAEQVVMVKNAVPGDVLNAKVYKKQKNFYEAEIQALLSPSPYRVQPRCQHFGTCGGCKLQHIDYPAQLQFKQKQVEDAILRIGKLKPKHFLEIQGSDNPFFYRNKLEFSFSVLGWKADKNGSGGEPALGFHAPSSWQKVVNIETCWLQDPLVNSILEAVRAFAVRHSLSFYNPVEHRGLLRNILFRNTAFTRQWMVGLIFGENSPLQQPLIQFLMEQFPQITTFITILNTKHNDSYTDLTWQTHKGEGFIYETLENRTYRISPLTFFQTNSHQALKLYQTIKAWIEQPVSCLYDLYAGCGSIGIFVADKAETIIGMEYVASAVRDAEYNLQLNQLTHLQYFVGDIAKQLTPEFIQKHGKPELVITDPPRAGMDAKVVQQLLSVQPPTILYISCNPSTQARDLQILSAKYTLERLQPFDLFPHTHHVESLALLKLK